MVIAAGGKKDGLGTVTLGDLKSENIAVKAERTIKIGHLEVDMANAGLGMDRRCGLRIHELSLAQSGGDQWLRPYQLSLPAR